MTKLRQLLKKKKMSGYALAKKSGMTPTGIYYIMSGKRAPTLESVRKISKALGVDVDDLF